MIFFGCVAMPADDDDNTMYTDKYSESSMFVWPHKLILKTCGTTTLLLGLDRLMAIAREHCGLQDVWRCFYSRKAFMFPERQIGPHRHWDEEVKFLDLVFGMFYLKGAARRLRLKTSIVEKASEMVLPMLWVK